MVSGLTPWELRAVVVDDCLLEGWCSSPWALRAAGGGAQDVPKRAAHHSSHLQQVERSVTEGSRDQVRVYVVHGRQGPALGGVVRAMPCWAGDSTSRLRRSRAAFVANLVVGGHLYDDDSANARLDAAGVTAVQMPAVRGAQRTTSQPNALDRRRVQDSSVGGCVCGSTRMVPAGRFAAVSRGTLTDACRACRAGGGLRDGGGRAVVEDDSRAGQ
jgi:hypothetical protein